MTLDHVVSHLAGRLEKVSDPPASCRRVLIEIHDLDRRVLLDLEGRDVQVYTGGDLVPVHDCVVRLAWDAFSSLFEPGADVQERVMELFLDERIEFSDFDKLDELQAALLPLLGSGGGVPRPAGP